MQATSQGGEISSGGAEARFSLFERFRGGAIGRSLAKTVGAGRMVCAHHMVSAVHMATAGKFPEGLLQLDSGLPCYRCARARRLPKGGG